MGNENVEELLKEEFYTPKELANLLNVTVSAVHYWLRNGKLRAIKTPGGHYRIPRSAVLELLKEGSQEASPAQ